MFHGQGWSQADFKGIMCGNVINKIWLILKVLYLALFVVRKDVLLNSDLQSEIIYNKWNVKTKNISVL